MVVLLDLPNETLFQIVKQVQLLDEPIGSNIGHPSSNLSSLTQCCRLLHEMCIPLARRLVCPGTQCRNWGEGPCPNQELFSRSDLDTYLKSVAYLDLALAVDGWDFSKYRSDSDLRGDCASCAMLQRRIRQHVDGPSPFSSLIGLRIQVPNYPLEIFGDKKRANSLVQKFIHKLTTIPSLRYLFIDDRSFEDEFDDIGDTASPPLPPIPASVAVGLELYFGPGNTDGCGRLDRYIPLVPNLVALRTDISVDPYDDFPVAWTRSLQRVNLFDYSSDDAGFRDLLDSFTWPNSTGQFRVFDDGYSAVDEIIDSGCREFDVDFNLRQIVFGLLRSPHHDLQPLLKEIGNIMPDIHRLGFRMGKMSSIWANDFSDRDEETPKLKAGLNLMEMVSVTRCIRSLSELTHLTIEVALPECGDDRRRTTIRSSAEALAAASLSLQYITLKLFTEEDFQGGGPAAMHLGVPYLRGSWEIRREANAKLTMIEIQMEECKRRISHAY